MKNKTMIIMIVLLVFICTISYNYLIAFDGNNINVVNVGISISDLNYYSEYYDFSNDICDKLNLENKDEIKYVYSVSDSLIWNEDYTDKAPNVEYQKIKINDMIDIGVDVLIVQIDDDCIKEEIIEKCKNNDIKLILINNIDRKELMLKLIKEANEYIEEKNIESIIYIASDNLIFKDVKKYISSDDISFISYNEDKNNLYNELFKLDVNNSLIISEKDSITGDVLWLFNNYKIDNNKIFSIGGNDNIEKCVEWNKVLNTIPWDYQKELDTVYEGLELE